MGASRKSYKISTRWKWGGITYKDKIKSIFVFLKNDLKYLTGREYFIKDNFTQPFNHFIGCKLFGHDFHLDCEDNDYICYKCWKRISNRQYESVVRRNKILKLKKKI